ncbi:eIF2A-related protein [Nocardia cyriacigeorgica]|uniref:nSTAND1 domain-containing NTPase n=1 Tax=Nocardia cyriacigeorgica TaxID=135487 RepID=UPI0018935F2B|nr:AAA family ATPase [Nocardia cyriacigeorgica]MBF6439280.1 WD40 repeat domain-containing protein [Nocardia cyriacigeorgica]
MGRPRFTGSLQVLLVLTTALLGIATNYATNQPSPPLALRLVQQYAGPAIIVLLLVLIGATVMAVRTQQPRQLARRWDSSRMPYPGLDSYTADEAAVFFGREEEIDELLTRMHGTGRDRFVVVVGASGSGKSSLVQAGVVPRLAERRWTVLPTLTPSADPVAALAHAVGGDVDQLRRDSEAFASMVLRARQRAGHPRSKTLLLVDQGEELFTLAGEQERARFLRCVDTALRDDHRLWVIMTVRVEHLGDFLDSPYSGLFRRPLALGALSDAELRSAITGPAELVGLEFAPGLVDGILADTATADALPLLAYLLQELYIAGGPSRRATFEHYHRLGGVAGSLSRQATEAVDRLGGSDDLPRILQVLLEFVTIDGEQAYRRRVPLPDRGSPERAVIDAFVDARLLVTGTRDGRPIAQAAHEALFRQWVPLRQEVEARAAQLRRRAELERWAGDWEQAGRNPDYLLTGDRLEQARQWIRDHPALAAAGVVAFVDESARRDAAFLRRVSEGIGEYVLTHVEDYPDLSVLLCLAALAECPPTPVVTRALMAVLAHHRLIGVLDLHTDAVRNVAWSPDGQLIATASRDGTARLWSAATRRCTQTLVGHRDMVEMVAWAPDSARVVTVSRDRTARVWNATTGHALGELAAGSDVARAVAWSADGTLIATGSRDRVIRLWNADSYTLNAELTGHTDNILGLAFSPDSTHLASGCHDRTVRVWDLSDHTAVVLEGHEDFVEGVAWSPDGTRLASAGGDATVRIWDIASGRQTMLIRCHEDRAWNCAWSTDGSMLATCGGDATARIWNPANAEEKFVLRGHSGDVWSVRWSPDSTCLVTGGADATARVWAFSPRGAESRQLTGHRGPVHRALPIGQSIVTVGADATIRESGTFDNAPSRVVASHAEPVLDASATASYAATSAKDSTVALWRLGTEWTTLTTINTDMICEAAQLSPDGRYLAFAGHDRGLYLAYSTPTPAVFRVDHHTDWITGLAWSPTSRYLASVSDDRTGAVWRVTSTPEGPRTELVTTLVGHGNWVDAVAWSSDESQLVTSGADNTARIWNRATGELSAILHGHTARVKAVAWSPDGTRIATGSYDRTVRLWDANSHNEIGVIGMHRDRITDVEWLPSGDHVLTASFDGTARIWPVDIDLDDLRARARTRAYRTLTPEERSAHLLPAH